MRRHRAWVLWRPVLRDAKVTKIPIDAHTGDAASSTDPRTWSTFAAAIGALRDGVGLGFVFADLHDLGGADLDDCRDPVTGAIAPWALQLAQRLDSYTEVSPSGRGIKCFFAGKLTGKGRRRGHVELYSRGRFFCVTGRRVPGFPAEPQPRQAELEAIVAQLFPPPAPRPAGATAATVIGDDAEILERARRARNGDRFARLWSGAWQAAGYGSQSEADLALASMLSFWAGGDPARVDALFRQSGLCRPKWLERSDYRDWTLSKATQGEVYRHA
ncbi:hypothetical protein KF840_21670 [bacterium]|nr:hypothetical protein [bacterium]